MSQKNIEIFPIIVQDTDSSSEIYCEIVIADSENRELVYFRKELRLCDLLKRSVLDELYIYSAEETVEELKKKLQKLKNSLNKKEMVRRSRNIGWNSLNFGKLQFSFSNCSITAEGVDYNNHAQEDGFNLCLSENYDDSLQHAKTRFLENMNILNREPDVLFPVFFVNITAMMAYFMGIRGVKVGISLWLDGQMGSGKTTVAQTVGNFLTADLDDPFKTRRNEITAFERTKIVLELMHRCRSIPMILDDKKAEKVSTHRDKVWNNIDILIRSVTSQCIELFGEGDELNGKFQKERFYSSVIITGEYLETYASTIARLIYLDMGNFINNMKASSAIRKYQKNPTLLADFMAHFCQFLCIKASDDQYWEHLVLTWEKLWKNNKGYFYGGNQSRFAQSMTALQIAAEAIRDFSHYCHADETFDTKGFIETVDKLSLKLLKTTQQKVDGDIALIQDAFREIIEKGELEIYLAAKVIKEYGGGWSEVAYALPENKNALWIADVKRVDPTAWGKLDRESDRYPVCIVQVKELYSLMAQKILELKKRYNYKGTVECEVTNRKLRIAEIICASKRTDGTYNMQFQYPKMCNNWGYGEPYVKKVDCICLNLKNPILKQIVREKEQRDEDGCEIYENDYVEKMRMGYFDEEMRQDINKNITKIREYI